jgi:hypothetical protein
MPYLIYDHVLSLEPLLDGLELVRVSESVFALNNLLKLASEALAFFCKSPELNLHFLLLSILHISLNEVELFSL